MSQPKVTNTLAQRFSFTTGMFRRTAKVDTSDLGHSLAQRWLEAFTKFLEASRLVESFQVMVLGKPSQGGCGKKA